MFIGGEWVNAASGATFESHNPFDGKPWALMPRAGVDDLADLRRAPAQAR